MSLIVQQWGNAANIYIYTNTSVVIATKMHILQWSGQLLAAYNTLVVYTQEMFMVLIILMFIDAVLG